MAFANPEVVDFKAKFVRDFPYTDSIDTGVTDADISAAFVEVNNEFNPILWSTQALYTQAYLYLTAHILSKNLQNASQGFSGAGRWVVTGNGVGSVSQSFQVPQYVMDNPLFGIYGSTSYGQRYLTMVLPRLVGSAMSVRGATRP